MAWRSKAKQFAFWGLGVVCFATRVLGADPGVQPSASQDVTLSQELVARVTDALEAEANGDFLQRHRLLSESEAFPPSKWQCGYLLEQGEWASIETSIEAARTNTDLEQYELRRRGLQDNASNHLALAKWCAQQGLFPQWRAHLNRVLNFDPENTEVRTALGYRQIGAEWISPQELSELQSQANFVAQSMRKHYASVSKILKQLQSGKPEEREHAQRTLGALNNEDAVPCVETVFASASATLVPTGLAWLNSIDSVAASKALTRFAVFHPDASVRRLAAQHLMDRPYHDFVPDLLKMLEAPVSMMLVPVVNRDGWLQGYRQAFAKETMDKKELLIVDRSYSRTTLRVPNTPQFSGVARRDSETFANFRLRQSEDRDEFRELNQQIESAVRASAGLEVAARTQQALQENLEAAERNRRVGSLVSTLAGSEPTANPRALWDWWDGYNETGYQESKPLEYRREALRSSVVNYLRQPLHECFVAGTPVLTRRGLRPIEQISVGDQVLSRDIGSGELQWKPVLSSSSRPPEAIVEIETVSDRLRCTSGHLFWVSGEGWRRASQLGEGDILHAAQEPTLVVATRARPSQATFNLEVADYGNYFVGKDRVLSHDVTPRSHNRQAVPGEQLLKELARAK